ncbi:MAG: NADPH-dependent FMN reductase [Chitinophagaceae bacterium]
MILKRKKIIGISGSLRSNSSASAVLEVVSNLVPGHVAFTVFTGLVEIPPFNDSGQAPLPVANFIKLITESDAVFFCIPEYAFGVPGALKNALDWTVSSTAFSGKPVALITAASSGDKAHAALLLTLSALDTKIADGTTLLISFVRSKLNEKGEVKDIPTFNAIKKVIGTLIQTIE